MQCPSDETIASLLADEAIAADRDTLVQHIEGCGACQEKLARLTDAADASCLRARQNTPHDDSEDSDSEDEAVRRMKSLRQSWARDSDGPVDTPKDDATLGLADQVTDSDMPAVPGYEIVGVLGRGGMAVVFKARHLALERTVALKMLQNFARAGEKDLARFRAEADMIARLQHPNIVQVYDVGEVAGRPYFALEYVAGGSLSQRLNGAPQSPRASARFVEVLARAVQAAHANGIVHRDLKPSNILLMPGAGATAETLAGARSYNALVADLLQSVPKIADFGIAKCANQDAQLYRSLTVTGDLLGTPSYMAPEQAAPTGLPIGPPADVYALGAIFYELLTGRPPFRGETPLDTLLQVLHNEPVGVTDLQPNVPRDLETICLKCLKKDPHHRYQSAGDLADDIDSFIHGRPIKARPTRTVEKVWRWIRDRPVPSALVAAGVLTPIVALVTLSLLSARLVRSNALDSAAQQAEVLERANHQYSLIVQRVEQAHYPVNKMFPPTPNTVPLSIPATFLHDVGEELHQDSTTGIQVHQYSDYPFPWRTGGGPRDEFERQALAQLRQSNGRTTVHEFTEFNGEPVVRYAQARVLKQSCVDCHNTHPLSTRKDWRVGDVRGVLEIIRPLKNDQARVTQALRLTLLLSAFGSGLLLLGSVLAVWTKRRRSDVGP